MLKHSKMVSALCKSGEDIANEATPLSSHLSHMALGIAGEAGEVVDLVKKIVIYKKDIDTNKLIEEMGDLEFYLEGLRQGLNISRDDVLESNIKKLSKRYEGFKYSDNAAIERADKK